jgi:hypothetical protein
MAFFLLQLGLGFLHHNHYSIHRKGNWKGFIHVWFGRVLIILGVFMTAFSFNSNKVRIEYGAVAIAVFLFYVAVVIRLRWAERKRVKARADEVE